MRTLQLSAAGLLFVAAFSAGVGGCADPDAEPAAPTTVEIDVGNGFACSRLDGQVTCWGEVPWHSPGQVSEPVSIDADGRSAVKVAVGYGTICIIRDDGAGDCAPFGNGRPLPDVVDVGVIYAWARPCFVMADGAVACTGTDAESPLTRPVTQIAAGGHIACGVYVDGTVGCWEGGNRKLIAVNDESLDAEQIAVGWSELCALQTNGRVTCFDLYGDSPGAVGEGRVIAGIESPIKIASGWVSCAVTSDRRVECWGENKQGLLSVAGLEEGEVARAPVEIPGLSDVADISVSYDQACAITTAGVATCWGRAATHFRLSR